MKGLIQQFILLFFLLVIMWVGITYVSQNIQYSSAKQMYNEIVMLLENYAFQQQVIEECIENAKKNGYQLFVQLYGEKKKDAKVTLKFSYTYPIVQRKVNYVIEGYAR